MRLLTDKIAVRFNTDHNKVVGTGINGLELIRPDHWINNEAEENEDSLTRFEENVNYLETHPQICVVLHPNANCEYREGDTLFVHYMALEWAETTEYGTIIETDFILFQILPDGELKVVNDTYLGKLVYEKEEETNGFAVIKEKKDSLKIKITHVAAKHRQEFGFGIGDTVISVDKNNYAFNYNGEKLIKLTRDEIVSILT